MAFHIIDKRRDSALSSWSVWISFLRDLQVLSNLKRSLPSRKLRIVIRHDTGIDVIIVVRSMFYVIRVILYKKQPKISLSQRSVRYLALINNKKRYKDYSGVFNCALRSIITDYRKFPCMRRNVGMPSNFVVRDHSIFWGLRTLGLQICTQEMPSIS